MYIIVNKQEFNIKGVKAPQVNTVVEQFIKNKDTIVEDPSECLIINNIELLKALDSQENVYTKTIVYETEDEKTNKDENNKYSYRKLFHFVTLPENDKYVSKDVYEYHKKFKINNNIYHGYLLKNYKCWVCSDSYGCYNVSRSNDCYACNDMFLCGNCIECNNMNDCEYCVECEECDESKRLNFCNNCEQCYDCNNCNDCNNANECDDCNDCSYCNDFTRCNRCHGVDCGLYFTCIDCNDCTDCANCTDCDNCFKCDECEGCTNCKGLFGGCCADDGIIDEERLNNAE